jgi:amino acid transporter
MIVGSDLFARLSPRRHMPVAALAFAGIVPAGIAVLGYFMENAIKTIIIFGSVGIYIAFQLIVLGALTARARGWVPQGKFRLGQWAWPVNVGALVFGVGAIINLMWPRSFSDPWYINYGMILTTAIVIGTGLIYMIAARPYDHGTTPAGDAVSPANNSQAPR